VLIAAAETSGLSARRLLKLLALALVILGAIVAIVFLVDSG
jgi:hypothetical protein